MYDASTARKKTKLWKCAKVEKAIDYAVSQGNSLCYMNHRVSDDDVLRLEQLGYDVRRDTDGTTWIYWFDTE